MSDSAVMETDAPLALLDRAPVGEPIASSAAAHEPTAPAGAAYTASAVSAGVLALEHLGLADALALRHRLPGHDFEDLRQVARLGLVMAAQQYREGTGRGFVHFAEPTIVGMIKQHLVARALVDASELELRLVRMQYVNQMSENEIAAELGMPQTQVSRLLQQLQERIRGAVEA